MLRPDPVAALPRPEGPRGLSRQQNKSSLTTDRTHHDTCARPNTARRTPTLCRAACQEAWVLPGAFLIPQVPDSPLPPAIKFFPMCGNQFPMKTPMTSPTQRRRGRPAGHIKYDANGLIRWSLHGAARELNVHRERLARRQRVLGIEPGEDGYFSSKDIIAMVHSDKEAEQIRLIAAQRQKLERENQEAEAEFIPVETVGSRHGLLSVRRCDGSSSPHRCPARRKRRRLPRSINLKRWTGPQRLRRTPGRNGRLLGSF